MRVAIVGAGLAGLRTAEALRQHGHDGAITLIGAERHLPYSRPPLSKEVLRGDAGPEAAVLRSSDELAALDLDLRLGGTATALRVADRTVALRDGSVVPFDEVVIATGTAPRTLATDLAGVHVLRTLDDCTDLQQALAPAANVVVVGAGFIGLEVAAAAGARGCHVTVVDLLPTPLARVFDPAIGAAVTALHESHGVTLRMGIGIRTLEGSGHVQRVVLDDGTALPADAVVVGVGVTPVTGWLADSGLTLRDGVACDESLRAAPGVWAVGDVARWPHPAHAPDLRVEHWTNATEQAQAVARAIVAGERARFDAVPYFWSDQHDAKLQSLGTNTLGDETVVVSGSLAEPRWVALVRAGDRLCGVIGMRSAGRVMKLRPLLAAGTSWRDALDEVAG